MIFTPIVRHCATLAASCILISGYAFAYSAPTPISLQQAEALAIASDPWQTGNQLKQQALNARSQAADSLPDPTVTLGVANLPTNTFDFDQEPMTQFKVGISQMFPRGDQQALQQQHLSIQRDQQPYLRLNRRAKIRVTVSQLWLDAYQAHKSLELIANDRDLFDHLVDLTQSSYAAAITNTQQQDVIRAQLELTRLDDRILRLQEQYDTRLAELSKWLYQERDPSETDPVNYSLAPVKPDIVLSAPQRWLTETSGFDRDEMRSIIARHPAIQAMDKEIERTKTELALAEQQYKPQWGVSASYGYREDAPMGDERADFFSIGVGIEVPLFSAKRQDYNVASAIAESEAKKSDKWLLIREMTAEAERYWNQFLRLNERQALYNQRLLSQLHEQAEASLSAYTNDKGDFSEVVRSQIAQLNARIEFLSIDIQRLKTIKQINYFFPTEATENQELQP